MKKVVEEIAKYADEILDLLFAYEIPSTRYLR